MTTSTPPEHPQVTQMEDAPAPAAEPTPRLLFARWLYEQERIHDRDDPSRAIDGGASAHEGHAPVAAEEPSAAGGTRSTSSSSTPEMPGSSLRP